MANRRAEQTVWNVLHTISLLGPIKIIATVNRKTGPALILIIIVNVKALKKCEYDEWRANFA